MDGVPGRKHFLWLLAVAVLGLTPESALSALGNGRTEDATVVFVLGAAGILGTAAFWAAQDVARRWRVWRRHRMARWQRRAEDDGAAVGFDVVGAAPNDASRGEPRAVLAYHAGPASRRWMLIAAVVGVWTAVIGVLGAFIADLLVPFMLR